MYQTYTGPHAHPQNFARRIAATTSATTNVLVCLNDSVGKAVSAVDENWGSFIQVTGSASPSGFYVAHALERLPGYVDMVGLCSAALSLGNMPTDCVVMAFTTTLDLSTGPNIPVSDATLTWIPLELGSGAPSISLERCFDVLNDKTVATYFGLAIYGTFGATARNMFGSISLRQVTAERATFQPNK